MADAGIPYGGGFHPERIKLTGINIQDSRYARLYHGLALDTTKWYHIKLFLKRKDTRNFCSFDLFFMLGNTALNNSIESLRCSGSGFHSEFGSVPLVVSEQLYNVVRGNDYVTISTNSYLFRSFKSGAVPAEEIVEAYIEEVAE